ncbi:hypothetical protein JCGZ_12655 [Jatropha curcas]|uniref:Uncharacterized protein n=1 Tax=Jatropha curcas TaxID=180498 RepID=A0A067KDY3_JATCU|nr:hypothetical protein JCGZ_12655 [Jatropha curcas]
MVVSVKRREGSFQAITRAFRSSQKSLKDALLVQPSPGSAPHVVIVMDALREFTIEPLRWALENIMAAGGVVTLLGIMPWLNIPLSSMTPEVWAVTLEELRVAQEILGYDLRMNSKYLKLQQVVDLCKTFDVVLHKVVVMGFPLRLMVVEKLTAFHPTWVVFDKHLKRNREFFARTIPCSMVMMNENGEADMIRGQPMINSGEFTPSESPASFIPTPELMISDGWNEILNE